MQKMPKSIPEAEFYSKSSISQIENVLYLQRKQSAFDKNKKIRGKRGSEQYLSYKSIVNIQ